MRLQSIVKFDFFGPDQIVKDSMLWNIRDMSQVPSCGSLLHMSLRFSKLKSCAPSYNDKMSFQNGIAFQHL